MVQINEGRGGGIVGQREERKKKCRANKGRLAIGLGEKKIKGASQEVFQIIGDFVACRP